MRRRKALAVAAASALTLGAAGLATAANLGLLAHAEEDPVGRLNATNVAELLDVPPGSTPPRVIVMDEPPAPVDPDAAPAPPPAVLGAESPAPDPWVTSEATREAPGASTVPVPTAPRSGGQQYEDPDDDHPESPDDHPEDDHPEDDHPEDDHPEDDGHEDGPEEEHDD